MWITLSIIGTCVIATLFLAAFFRHGANIYQAFSTDKECEYCSIKINKKNENKLIIKTPHFKHMRNDCMKIPNRPFTNGNKYCNSSELVQESITVCAECSEMLHDMMNKTGDFKI